MSLCFVSFFVCLFCLCWKRVNHIILWRGEEPLDLPVELGVEGEDVEKGRKGGRQQSEDQRTNLPLFNVYPQFWWNNNFEDLRILNFTKNPSIRNTHLQVNFRQNKDKGGQNLKIIYIPTEKCPKTEVDSSTRFALATKKCFFSLSLKQSCTKMQHSFPVYFWGFKAHILIMSNLAFLRQIWS